MRYYVYIVRCKDKSLYVGYTTNIAKRIEAHNSSKRGAKYTKSRRPVVIVHTEMFKSLSKALKREHEIKSWPRKAKLDLIASTN